MNNNSLDIYLMGICGTGVGSLAGLLRAQGHRVRGSDANIYPPMSTKLAEWGVPVLEGFDAKHLEPAPDLVVVGNVIRANNPEAVYVRERGLQALSMPQALARFGIGERHSIVIAGTHGKTTVTALVSHLLMQAGRDPSFLIGGAPVGYAESFRTAPGPFFVVEGDEYDTAYFDKGPKFVHYKPRTAVITSLEYDHADIYASLEAVEEAFKALVLEVPAEGLLVVWHGAERARRLVEKHARTSQVLGYATHRAPGVDLWLERYSSGPDGLEFEPVLRGRSLGTMKVPMWGELSACNVLAALGAVSAAELSPEELRRGFATFQGVQRRLELRGEPRGIAVVDDFGHHPTAVRLTIEAARTRWPGRRMWAVFEPRSATSRRNVFQREYVDALGLADLVVISSHERLAEIPAETRFDPARVADDVRQRGGEAQFVPEVADIVEHIAGKARRGDVILVFSNGAFGGLHDKLLVRLDRNHS